MQNSLENTVAYLEHVSSITLPRTLNLCERPSLITDGKLIARDHHGPLHVFDLETGREISRILFKHAEAEQLATDGTNLFIYAKGEFNINDNDILFAKNINPIELRDPEGTSYVDGIVEYVGKPIGRLETKHWMHGSSTKNGVDHKLISFPIGNIPNVVFYPDMFAEKNGNARYIFPREVAMVFLHTDNDHIVVSYNNHFGEGGCQTSQAIRADGKPYEHLQNLEAITTQETPIALDFHLGRFSAKRYPISSEEQLPPEALDEFTEFDPEDYAVAIPIVFANGRAARERTYGKIHRTGDTVRVFYGAEKSDSGVQGGGYSLIPAVLDTYKLSIKRLEDAKLSPTRTT